MGVGLNTLCVLGENLSDSDLQECLLELPATGQVRARTIKLECRETTKCAGVSRRVMLIFQLCGFYCKWRCGFVCGSRFRGLESGLWLKEPFAVPASLEPTACAVKECPSYEKCSDVQEIQHHTHDHLSYRNAKP